MSGTVDLFGETFTLAGEISEYSLGEFAEAAAEGQDGDSMQGMASLMRLVNECLAEGDRGRFKKAARAHKAKFEDLLVVVMAAFEQQTERPTGRPSDSSDGPVSIEPKSESSSADKALERFDGRPDLKLAILRNRQAS